MSKYKDEPNEITEMYKEFRKKKQAGKDKIRTERINTLFGCMFELKEAGIEVFEITPYQYRLIQGEKKIDYYPTSGKYFILNVQKWGQCSPEKVVQLFKQ